MAKYADAAADGAGGGGDDPFRDAGGPPKPGEPGYERYKNRPYDFYDSLPHDGLPSPAQPEVDALKAYRRQLDHLDVAAREEAKFLAKMWAYARYCGLEEQYVNLLSTAMKLRPDRISAAGRVMRALAGVYELARNDAQNSYNAIRFTRWTGDAAIAFDNYFNELLKMMGDRNVQGRTLYGAAVHTGTVIVALGDALKKWRHKFAIAIKEAAEMDRQTERKIAEAVAGGAYDAAATESPMGRVLALVKALVSVWSAIDEEGKKEEENIRKIIKDLGEINLSDESYANVAPLPGINLTIPDGLT